MSEQRCVVCTRPVNGANLCIRCEAALDIALGQVPALIEQLELTVTRQAAISTRNGSRSTEKPLAYNWSASHDLADMKITFVGWIRDLGPEIRIVGGPVCVFCAHESCKPYRQEIWPDDNPISMSRFLMRKTPQIRLHPAADAIHDELIYCIKQAWRAIDRPANRSRVFIAGCLEVSCDGELHANVPTADYQAGDPATHARITCTICDVIYPAETWMMVGKRIRALKVAS